MKIKSFNDVFAHFYKEVVTTYKIMIISEHSVLVFSHVFLNIFPSIQSVQYWRNGIYSKKIIFHSVSLSKMGNCKSIFQNFS